MAPDPIIEVSAAANGPALVPGPPEKSESTDLTDTENGPDGASNGSFEPPNGGLIAWSQVLASLLINCMSWGYPGAFGVFQLYYKEALQLPSAQISWIGSVQVFLEFMICTLSGRLADAGYTRLTIIVGASMTVLGTLLTSFATEYWQIFLAQGLMTGFGLGLMFMPAVTAVNSYFTTKRSFALAVSATGTGMGSVVFPSVIQYLIPRFGFAWAVRCQALVALVMVIIALLLLRPRLAPRRAGPWIEWGAFREPPYVLYATGSFLYFWALYFGFFYVSGR
jgi:MFS transporter, MCT family, solute carrier family 16 (monocarboxylic acid transporters), member 3